MITIKRTSKSLQEEEEAERIIAIQCNRYKIVSGRLDICLMRQHNYLNKKSIQRNRGKRILDLNSNFSLTEDENCLMQLLSFCSKNRGGPEDTAPRSFSFFFLFFLSFFPLLLVKIINYLFRCKRSASSRSA